MGENTEPVQDVETSAEESESTSTFTKAEFDKRISDISAKYGREKKQAELERDDYKSQLESAASRLDELERSIAEREYDEAKSDPEKLSTYQRKKQIEDEKRKLDEFKRELERERGKIKEEADNIKRKHLDITYKEMSVKSGLSEDDIRDLGIEDPDVLARVVDKFSKKKPQEVRVDSGVSDGVPMGEPTTDKLEKMSMEAIAKYVRGDR